ncbi:MAG: hypothetical protein MMC33_007249 [Icmadophila ericetorum]|nr:hypothetical protein [Icmadophila ericetorum]
MNANEFHASIDYLEEVKSRLNNMDKTISDLQNCIKEVATKPAPQEQQLTSLPVRSGSQGSDLDKASGQSDQCFAMANRHLVNEQYYGSSSLVSLLGEIQVLLKQRSKESDENSMIDNVMDRSDGLAECLTMMESIAKSSIMDDHLDLSNDGFPLGLPPKRILEPLLEPYFDQLHWSLPIFRREAFCENVRKCYVTEPGKVDLAWIVCFNSIIVQTLNARALGISSQALPEARTSHTYGDSMEVELLGPFLINFRRGLDKLGRFLEPKLVNVQALISMCIIAQGNYEYRLASLLLHQACFVAKSMGLHQQKVRARDQTQEETLECKYVFWALYMLDKTITLTTGHSCCLPLADCDVGLPDDDMSNPYLKQYIARIELATVQEDCYQNLYSSQASRRGETETANSIQVLDQKLVLWANKYPELSYDRHDEKTAFARPCDFNTTLNYYFHGVRILVHRPGKDLGNKDQCCNDARACVQLFRKLNSESLPGTMTVLLRQNVQNHPLIPFLILFANVVDDPESKESARDFQLMNDTSDVLKQIQRFDQPRSHAAKLYSVVSLCCQVAAAVIRCASSPNISSPTDNGVIFSADLVRSPSQSQSSSFKNESKMSTGPLWMSLGQSPVLSPMMDQPPLSQNWGFDFNNIIDPNISIRDQDTSLANPGLSASQMEQIACAGWQKDWVRSAAAADAAAGWPSVFGETLLNESYPVRWSEKCFR